MSRCIRIPLLLTVFVIIWECFLAGRLQAQNFRTLHNFTGTDGASPQGGLVIEGNTLYGAASTGGTETNGAVFALNTDGTGFTVLHSFTALSNSTNSDGAGPVGRLVLSGDTLYGTAYGGGKWGNGTVFTLKTNGTGFSVIHSFTSLSNSANLEGVYPSGGLVLAGNTLYGAALYGGSFAQGAIFAINLNGSDSFGFTNLHSFTPRNGFPGYFTNSDGALPNGGLVLWGNTLYGTAQGGGQGGWGTVFAVNTDGGDFQTVHSFIGEPPYNYEGAVPSTGVVLSGNTLYGDATFGGDRSEVEGSAGFGTVFAVNTDGTGFSVLHSFPTNGPIQADAPQPNTDGVWPYALLLLSGNTLYGTASLGGEEDNGTIFAIKTDGSAFTVLHSFSAPINSTNSDGANPFTAGLAIDGNTLYGTTTVGGSSGDGTVFSISFSPQLNVTQYEPGLVLAWPTNYAGFDYSRYTLQSTTNLASPIWTSNLPAPIVINGQFTVTNPVSGTKQFFRLSR